MAEREVRIKIGAAVDRDLTNVFPSLETAARRARKTIKTEMDGAFGDVSKGSKVKIKEVEKQFDELAAWAMGTSKKIENPLLRVVKEISKESRANLGDARMQFALLGREATQQLGNMERAARRAAAEQHNFGSALRKALDSQSKISAGGLYGAARPFGRAALRMGRFALSEARQLGGALARGMGVQTDLTSMFQQGVGLESSATFLSNMSYQPGAQGAAGRRIAPSDIVRDVRKVSDETAMDPTKVLEGLRDYVGRTGDLETGRHILKSSAVVSRATGAELEDVMGAAGDISLGLGTNFKGDRAKATERILRGVAGQGKMGAMEMRSFSKQMAKIAAQAGQFGSNRTEDTITTLAALAQESRQQGGSGTAAQSATAVSQFVNSLSKGKTINSFKKFGINLRDKQGVLEKPEDIIVQALQAAGSSQHGGMAKFSANMATLVSENRARTVTKGYEKIYQETFNATSGDEKTKQAAATKAVIEELNRLRGAAMSLEETNESYRASMQTTEAKVQVFNNKMAETADKLRIALMPAVEALAPKLISAATAAATFIDKLTGNAGAEKTATEAEQNLAMRSARTRRLLHGKPTDAQLSGLGTDVEGMEAEVAVIQQDVNRRKAAIAERQNVKRAPWWMGVGAQISGEIFDRVSGNKEQREAAVAGDQQRVKYQEQQLKETNDTLREIHKRFDSVLKVQVVGGTGQPPAAADNPLVRTGPPQH